MRYAQLVLLIGFLSACSDQFSVEDVSPRVVYRSEIVTVRFSEPRSYISIYLDDTELRDEQLSISYDTVAFRVPTRVETGKHTVRVKAGDRAWEKVIRVVDRATPPRFKSVVTLDEYRTCALDTHGELWCWGRNIPDGYGLVAETPVRVNSIGAPFKHIVVNESYVYALSSTGATYSSPESQILAYQKCCFEHMLPVNNHTFISTVAMSPNGAIDIDDTTAVLTNVPRDYRKVALAHDFACAIDKEQQVVCWGENPNGELGIGVTGSTMNPTAIAEPGPWNEVVVGKFVYGFGCGLKSNGEIWCWGTEPYATLDPQSKKSIVHYSMAPYRILEVREHSKTVVAPAFETISSSQGNACAISNGRVFAWGLRETPFLSLSPDQFVEQPTRVDMEGDWQYVACSLSGYICAINVNGDIGCWHFLEGEDFSPVTIVKVP